MISGGCHCNNVQFQVQIDKRSKAWDCNCSICRLKRNVHCIIPKTQFQLISCLKPLTEYTFGTHTAKHLFCPICGVVPYYIPRSNPDGYAVTIACLDQQQLSKQDIQFEIIQFDGQNWDQSYEESNIANEA